MMRVRYGELIRDYVMLCLQLYERISNRQLSRFGDAGFHRYLTAFYVMSVKINRVRASAEVSVNFI